MNEIEDERRNRRLAALSEARKVAVPGEPHEVTVQRAIAFAAFLNGEAVQRGLGWQGAMTGRGGPGEVPRAPQSDPADGDPPLATRAQGTL